jgi:hypothetical protein
MRGKMKMNEIKREQREGDKNNVRSIDSATLLSALEINNKRNISPILSPIIMAIGNPVYSDGPGAGQHRHNSQKFVQVLDQYYYLYVWQIGGGKKKESNGVA